MMIYDAWGNEIQPEKKPDERPLVVASLQDRWSSYPSQGLTPETLAAIFKEADLGNVWRQAELFEEMEEKDTHLFSILQTRRMAVTGLDFKIQPYSEDARDGEIAAFVSEVINDLADFEGNLSDILDAIGKGYSVLELLWDVRQGRNVIRHMEFVHPRRVTWYNTLTPRLFTEENRWQGMEIPPFKTIFHLHKMRSGYANRQGVLRTVAWMYLFKNYDIKDWMVFAEIFGMPLRLGKYDSTASKEDKESLFRAVKAIGRDAAAVISKSTEIEFIEAVKDSGRNVFEALAGFCNAEMSKAVLGQTLTTQQDGSGSYSLGRVHNEVRRDLLESDCEMVSKTLRRDMIRPLVGFNFGWEAPLPWFRFHYGEPDGLEREAARIKILVDAGVKTIPANWVHEKFNIPMPEDGAETLSPPTGWASPTGQQTGDHTTRMQAAMKSCLVCLANKLDVPVTRDQEMVDRFIDSTLSGAAEALAGNEERIMQVIQSANSYEEVMARLLELYPKVDTGKLRGFLEQSIFQADVFGQYTVRENKRD